MLWEASTGMSPIDVTKASRPSLAEVSRRHPRPAVLGLQAGASSARGAGSQGTAPAGRCPCARPLWAAQGSPSPGEKAGVRAAPRAVSGTALDACPPLLSARRSPRAGDEARCGRPRGGRGGEDAAGPRCHSPTQEPPVHPARGAALAMKTGKRSRRDAPGDSCTAWPGEADLTGHNSRDAHLGREDAGPRGRAVRPPGGLRPGGVRGGLSPEASAPPARPRGGGRSGPTFSSAVAGCVCTPSGLTGQQVGRVA